MDDRRVIDILRESVPETLAVYRFGSSTRGQLAAGSDLDYAILARRPLDAVERFELQERLAAALRRDVDLVDVLRASTVMRMQVVSRGLLIFDGDPALRRRFEDYVFSSYARLNEERRALLEQIRAEGVIHAR